MSRQVATFVLPFFHFAVLCSHFPFVLVLATFFYFYKRSGKISDEPVAFRIILYFNFEKYTLKKDRKTERSWHHR
jgi:hypothetical protein